MWNSDEAPQGRCSYVVHLIDPLNLNRQQVLRRIPTGSAFTEKRREDQAVEWAEAYTEKHPRTACEVAAVWMHRGREIDQESDLHRCYGAIASKAADIFSRDGSEEAARAVLAQKAG